MIKIFYGNDRVKAQLEVKKTLGEGYEVIEGENVTSEDMPSIFWGSSLFAPKRNILVKDLSTNKEAWSLLPQYLKTEHRIVVWEQGLKKNTKVYKELTKAHVAMREFRLADSPDMRLVFNILDTAWFNGPKAVKMLEKLENDQDPYRFMGLMATQAINKYTNRPNAKTKKVLKELAKLDMQLKTTKFSSQPWSLIEAFLLRVQEIK